MKPLLPSSMRVRLLLFLLLVIAPLLLHFVYLVESQSVREVAAVRKSASRITEFIAVDLEQIIEGVHQVLAVVGVLFDVSEEPGERNNISRVLSDLVRSYESYTNMTITAPDGTILFEAVPGFCSQWAGSEPWFGSGLQRGDVAVEVMTAGGECRHKLLAVAHGVRGMNGDGPIRFVTAAFLDMGCLDRVLTAERLLGHLSLLPEGAVVNVVDRNGVILARHPTVSSRRDQEIWRPSLMNAVREQRDGVIEDEGMDGVYRIYAFTRVEGTREGIFVSVGIPKENAFVGPRHDLVRGLTAGGIVVLITGILSWILSDILVVSPAKALVRTARRLADGDLTARAGLRRGPAEMVELGTAFDAMAGALQQRDIERDRAEQEIVAHQRQLRELASQLSLAEEAERRKLGSELHDQIGQVLAAIRLRLARFQKARCEDEAAAADLEDVQRLVSTAVDATKSLTYELTSPILHILGLESALEQECEEMERRHGVPILFRDDRQPKPLGREAKIVLFRATRELLYNVVKHARANEAIVSVRREANNVRIVVEDDGIGFDAAILEKPAASTKHFGIFNIRERIYQLNGSVIIHSAPGQGTSVTMDIPVLEQGAARTENHI